MGKAAGMATMKGIHAGMHGTAMAIGLHPDITRAAKGIGAVGGVVGGSYGLGHHQGKKRAAKVYSGLMVGERTHIQTPIKAGSRAVNKHPGGGY